MTLADTYAFLHRAIAAIEARTEPLSETIIASKGDVTACLELAGGAAERFGLKPGDRVEHRFFNPARK